ncbi:sensor histidine kinase [Saccharicrinis sp. FJH54]|uniref:sensor histidine kinase n=1 Tax=Saccharicrinis sp. FJH54 TaxID=3344665 RepID=UPI0035D3E6B7
MAVKKYSSFLTVVYHSLFWLVYCLFMASLIGANGQQPFWFVFTHYLSGIPAFALYAYTMLLFFVPALLTKNRNYTGVSLIVLASTVAAVILYLVLNHFVFYGLFWPRALAPEKWFSLNLFIQSLLPIWIPTMFLVARKFTAEWLKESKAKTELEKENLETELKMLKNQLNPHFLFNTLNNLYTLALMKSDKTPEMISRLSDMFQFILYECNAPVITLKKEMNLINNYVKLQQLRYGDRLDYSIQSDVGVDNFRIAPMILFTFVENCFKHGSGADPGIPWIKLYFERKGEKLLFIAENSKPGNSQAVTEVKKGIGLSNMQKRLDLLYSGHYKLNIKETDRVYKAELLMDEL